MTARPHPFSSQVDEKLTIYFARPYVASVEIVNIFPLFFFFFGLRMEMRISF